MIKELLWATLCNLLNVSKATGSVLSVERIKGQGVKAHMRLGGGGEYTTRDPPFSSMYTGKRV